MVGILDKGPGAADEVRALFDRLRPTLPIVLANLVSVGEVAVTYQPSLEQLLVLLPQGTAVTQGVGVAQAEHDSGLHGRFLGLQPEPVDSCAAAPIPLPPQQLPPPCTTGFLPAQQQRVPTFEDYPDRPAGDAVLPSAAGCAVQRAGCSQPALRDRPGQACSDVARCAKATTTTCRSTTATTGRATRTPHCPDSPYRSCLQERHHLPRAASPPGPAPPLAAAEYDPATGTYVGPDGRIYTQADLGQNFTEDRTWQDMLLPPTR